MSALAAMHLIGSNPTAAAQAAITLDSSFAFPKTTIEPLRLVTGACGSAVVRVIGVTAVSGNVFHLDMDGRIVLHNGRGHDLVLDADSVLSDKNGLACTTDSGATHLLIWSNCGGSACGDNFSFTVIDPERMQVVSPKECEEICACNLTGSRLPWKLNHKRLPPAS